MLRATNRARFAAACFSLFFFSGLAAQGAEVVVKRQDCLRLLSHAPGDGTVGEDQLAGDPHGRTVGPADFGASGAVTPPEIYRVEIEIDSFGQDEVRQQDKRLREIDIAIALTRREIAALEAGHQDSAAAKSSLAGLQSERAALLTSLSLAEQGTAKQRGHHAGRLTVMPEGDAYLNGQPLQPAAVEKLVRACRARLEP